MIRFLSIAIAFLACRSAEAYLIKGSMGRDPRSSHGQCLNIAKPTLEEAKSILRENRVKVSMNVQSDELIALATGIKKIQALHGSPLESIDGASFIYTDTDQKWNQDAGPIHINRNWSTDTGMNTLNIGMLMHELGHYVANKKGSEARYAAYFKAVPEPCLFSWYSTHKRTEEYADVFSTMIVNPENLLGFGSDACRKAYHFFRNSIFTHGDLAKCPKSDPQQKSEKSKKNDKPTKFENSTSEFDDAWNKMKSLF